MHTNTSENYANHYALSETIFPSAFAIKVFLGNTHGLREKIRGFLKPSILEIGFGDGRDIMLFNTLGYSITGLEINEKIVDLARKKLNSATHSSSIDLKVGSNINLPRSQKFDMIYSSAALYYLEKDNIDFLQDVLIPIGDLLKKNGLFIATFAKSDTHYIKNAVQVKKNVYMIKDEVFKLRNNQLIYAIENKKEMIDLINDSGLKLLRVGDWSVDWFGINESMYMIMAEKI